MGEAQCPRHRPRKFKECGCAPPAQPAEPRLTDVCRWCLHGTYASAFCKGLGHWNQIWQEYLSAFAFWKRMYGSGGHKPVTAPNVERILAGQIIVPASTREYLSSIGQRGGASRSEAKVKSARENIRHTRTHRETFAEGGASK
jgi:hypothetical protein